MNKVKLDPGSFRDPAGKIFYYNEKVLRVLDSEGEDRFNFLKKNNLLENCTSKNFLIQTNELKNES